MNLSDISESQKARLWDEIIRLYTETPFGAVPKTHLDAVVYGQLEEVGYFKENDTIQSIAIQLKITPSKVRSLMLNSGLVRGFRTDDNDIIKALISKAKYASQDMIAVTIDNPIIKLKIQQKCSEKQIYSDTSFNRNILKFPIDKYAQLLETFVPDKNKHKLNRELLQQIKNNKWDISKQEIRNNPIVAILKFGAKCAIEDVIGDITDGKNILQFIYNTISNFIGS